MKNLFNKNKSRKVSAKYKIQRNNFHYIKQKNNILRIQIEVTENKKFWESLKSHFGQGDSNSEKNILLQNNLIKTNEKEIATILNNFLLTLPKIYVKNLPKCVIQKI